MSKKILAVLVVCFILFLLISSLLAPFSSHKRSQRSVCVRNLVKINQTSLLYKQQNGRFPSPAEIIEAGVPHGYLTCDVSYNTAKGETPYVFNDEHNLYLCSYSERHTRHFLDRWNKTSAEGKDETKKIQP